MRAGEVSDDAGRGPAPLGEADPLDLRDRSRRVPTDSAYESSPPTMTNGRTRSISWSGSAWTGPTPCAQHLPAALRVGAGHLAARSGVRAVGRRRRRPGHHPYGEHVAGDLAYGLAEHGWTVVSGGAFGIDAAAHRGALAGDGCTIAVLACGIDRPYPAAHAASSTASASTAWCSASGRRRRPAPPPVPGPQPGHRRRDPGHGDGRGEPPQRGPVHPGRARAWAGCMAVPGPVTSACRSAATRSCARRGRSWSPASPTCSTRSGGSASTWHRCCGPRRRHATGSARLRQVLDGVRPRKVLAAEQIAAAVGVSSRDARRTLPALEAGRS